jgi:hypothetical protein
MKHFGEAQWADFVRDLMSPTGKMAMQEHIDKGCEKCSETLRIWQSVSSIAGAENAATPPEDTVRVVKSQFAAIAAPASSGVRLVFDSLLQPLTAGIRGSVAARQFLYETDEYYIDLRLEPRAAADCACLVGQVLNRTGAERAAQGVAIRLREGKLPLAHTSTNEFGEFQLEFEAGSSLNVSISRDQAPEIILPLYGVQTKSAKQKDVD